MEITAKTVKTPVQNTSQTENEVQRIELDCFNCTSESLFEINELKDYLLERIKVKGRTGQLGKNITVSVEDAKVIVEYKKFTSKRYLKFLGKKFLRLKKLNSWVRLVANAKTSYKFSFYNVDKENEE